MLHEAVFLFLCFLEINKHFLWCSRFKLFQKLYLEYLTNYCLIQFYFSTFRNNVTNKELSRLKPYKMLMFVDKHSIFVHKPKPIDETSHILNVAQAVQKVRETNESFSFQGLLNIKKFTPSLSSRTDSLQRENSFGTPGINKKIIIKLSVYFVNLR